MTCARIQQQLTRYLERMCTRSEVATLARHIESCPTCAQQLAALQHVKSLIHKSRTVDMNPFVLSEMMTVIRERTTQALPGLKPPTRRLAFVRRTRYVMAAAAVVFLTAVTIAWHRDNTPPPIVQNLRESDDMTIYLQEHALHADQSVFSNGVFGSVMVSSNGKKLIHER